MYVYAMPREPRTPKGLNWCRVAFSIYLGYLAVQIAMGVWMTYLLSTLTTTPTIGSTLELAALAMVFLALTVLLGLITLIIFFLGYGYLYGGREEFGPAHKKNLGIGLGMLVGAIIAAIAGFLVQFFLIIRMIGNIFSGDPNFIYNIMIASTISGTIMAVLVALMLVFGVRAIARPGHQPLLYIAAIIGMITPGVVGGLTYLQIARFIDLFGGGTTTISIDSTWGLPTLIGGALGIVTFVLFLFVYHKTLTRIKTGEIRPIMPQPQPIPWTPGYPPQPYPVVPAQPVYPPPPQQPPPGAPPGQ